MLWLRQRWDQTTSSLDSPLKTSYECPPHSLVTASVTHILAFSPHELLGHSDCQLSWTSSLSSFPLSDCPSVQWLRLQTSRSPAYRSLWSVHTRGLLPHSSAGRNVWVKDHEKACHPRSFKPFCTHFPSFLFQNHFFSTVAVEHESKHTYLIYQDVFYT